MIRSLGAACLAVLVASAVTAGEPTREQVEFFEAKVRPVLVARCYSCHSDAQKKTKGGLVVDSLAGLLAGGDGGPALVPGDPDASRVVEAVRYVTEELRMPPKGKLPDAEIEALAAWVKMGAPWPNAKLKPGRPAGKITAADRDWWAFRPVVSVPPPAAGAGWARNDLDRFVAAKLADAKLTPAPEAERGVLIRRLTFDLTGLPPTPEAVAAFAKDAAPDAYERLADRLLASPAYGERWARHWLDLVRYADSDGFRIDDYRPDAWRYRDYVIRSFNADKPYDRFVQEQLAGDELFPGDPDALVATGYLRHGIYEYNNRDVRGQWATQLDDITDTTADVFLGVGLQCARCHDHKFDPLQQKDYYRLQAFFAGIMPREDLVAATAGERTAHAAKLAGWEAKTATLRSEIAAIEAPYRVKAREDAIDKFPPELQVMIRKPAADRDPHEHQLAELAYRQVTYEYDRLERSLKGADKDRVLALRRDLAKFDALKPPPLPVALAATDGGPVAPPTTVPKKGPTPVEPGFLSVLDETPATIAPVPGLPDTTGRRAALANWLTRPDNPLTARVLVNRVWQQHFGRGLAANASDFGRLGDTPTHPELLDFLAAQFVADGWSVKKLHRAMVLSATYRQSATHPDPAPCRLADPENKLLGRGGVRRLDAEQIRDALYAVVGDLDPKAGGPGVATTDPRRSVYTKVMRNNRDPLLDVFDAPLAFQSASSRDTTTTPVQSLLLINSPTLLRRSQAFADRLKRDEPTDDARRVARAYRLAFGRAPTADEAAAAVAFVAEQARRVDPTKAGSATAAFVGGKIPHRDGQAADLKPGSPGYEVPLPDAAISADFTIEAYLSARSVADTAAVRTVAAKWDGDVTHPGWGLGLTGKGSRRKPQTLALQLVGKKLDGTVGEEAVFADHHVALAKPYYLAVAVKLARGTTPGQVTFSLKDLSNDDEPLLVATVPHSVTGGLGNALPFTIGGRSVPKADAGFDGLIDDVRLSDAALGADQLLYTREGTSPTTAGYWRFEAKPGVFKDTSPLGRDIRPATVKTVVAQDTRQAAWADLCHVLLNASEFLYVE